MLLFAVVNGHFFHFYFPVSPEVVVAAVVAVAAVVVAAVAAAVVVAAVVAAAVVVAAVPCAGALTHGLDAIYLL